MFSVDSLFDLMKRLESKEVLSEEETDLFDSLRKFFHRNYKKIKSYYRWFLRE